MKNLTFFALLASATAATAAGCIVPEVIFNSLDGPLTVTLESVGASIPGVDGTTVEYRRQTPGTGAEGGVVPPGTRPRFGGRYKPGIYPYGGLIIGSNMTDGSWILEGVDSQAYIVPPVDKPRFRRVAFMRDPAAADALKVRAGFACGKDDKARLVMMPEDDLEFCVYPENKKRGEYGLWVQSVGQGEPTCCCLVLLEKGEVLTGGSGGDCAAVAAVVKKG